MITPPSKRDLTRRYMAALAVIGLLSATLFASLDSIIAAEEDSTAVVNISGRQRMLSQRIASLSLQMAAAPQESRQALTSMLDEAVSLMTESHEALISGSKTLRIPEETATRVRMVFDSPDLDLTDRVRSFIAQAREVAKAGPEAAGESLRQVVERANSELLGRLDEATRRFQVESQRNIHRALLLGRLSLVAVLALLIVLGLFLFRPMVKAIIEAQRCLVKQRDELERLSVTDELTGAINRRKLGEALAAEVDRSARYATPLTLILYDIDRFKMINDTFGHAAGDRTLLEMTRLVRSSLRRTDILARWGGEEFVVLSPETAMDGAKALAEKVRSVVATHKFPLVGRVTVSLGVAELRKGESGDALFKRADAALYAAKEKGRNRVEAA